MNTIRQAAIAVVEAEGPVEYAIALDALRVEADRMEAELRNASVAVIAEAAEVDRLQAKLADAKSLADHHLLAANNARAKLAALEKQKPVAYQYLFNHPAGGQVWRNDCSDWNGQHFLKGRSLYLSAGAKE